MRLCVLGLLLCSSCLDFGKFEQGGGAGQGGADTGGNSAGGNNTGAANTGGDNSAGATSGGGGEGGATPICPATPPTEPCATPTADFDGPTVPSWTPYPGLQLFRSDCPNGDQSDCGLTVKSKPPERNVLRSDDASQVDTCSASIRLEETTDEGWTFLELAPDQGGDDAPDLSQRAEIAVRPGRVRFIVGGTPTHEQSLPTEVPVDSLRIQVRPDGLALEALAGGAVVGCFLAERPAGFKAQVRVGIGLDASDESGSATRSSTFDDYGLVR